MHTKTELKREGTEALPYIFKPCLTVGALTAEEFKKRTSNARPYGGRAQRPSPTFLNLAVLGFSYYFVFTFFLALQEE